MSTSRLEQQILHELAQLPLEHKRRVLEFARALALSLPKGTPGSKLLRFAGTIAPDDLQAISDAIESGCEKVDSDEW